MYNSIIVQDINIPLSINAKVIVEYDRGHESYLGSNLFDAHLNKTLMDNLEKELFASLLRHNIQSKNTICIMPEQPYTVDILEYIEALPFENVLVTSIFFFDEIVNRLNGTEPLYDDQSNSIRRMGKFRDKNLYIMYVDTPKDRGVIINLDSLLCNYKFERYDVSSPEVKQQRILDVQYGIGDYQTIHTEVFTDSQSPDYIAYKRKMVIADIIKD